MPGISEDDRKDVDGVFSQPSAFGNFSEDRRDALKDRILETYCMIPSMALFANHMRILEKLSLRMKELLEIGGEHGKRGQGCVKPLEDVLRELYTADRNNRDEYQIQTMSGWRTIHAPFKDRQELSCRQLWLFVMRHDDPALIDQDHLAYVAKQLGFYSSLIEAGASNYASSDHAEPPPISWADYSVVPAEQPLGQKGGRWLAKSRQARKYLFFDVAEIIGTQATQRVQEPETFAPLVELTCIYRAFFGHPFVPSRYAKHPPMGGDVNPAVQALANASSEISIIPREPPDRGQNSPTESLGNGELIYPDGDSPRAPSERQEERQNGLEGYYCLPLCEAPEGEDLSSGSSTPHGHDAVQFAMELIPSIESATSSPRGTAEPETHGDRASRSSADSCDLSQSESQKFHSARSSTWNDGSSAGAEIHESCSAGTNAPNSFSSTESEMRYPSIAERSPPSPRSGSVQARSESNDSTARGSRDRLANTNDQIQIEPGAQGNRSAANPVSISTRSGSAESEVRYPSIQEVSPSILRSGAIQVRNESNENTSHAHGDRSAGISTLCGQITTEPEATCSHSSETSTTTSPRDLPIESEVNYHSVSKSSSFGPKTGPSGARGDIEALDWLDLAHLQPPGRIQPTVERSRGSCPPSTGSLPSRIILDRECTAVPPLDPSTKIETQEHVDQRPTGEADDRASQKGTSNQPESVIGESPPASLDTVEETQESRNSPTTVGSLGEAISKQNSSGAQPAPEHGAPALEQTNQGKPSQQAQAPSENAKTAGPVLEETQDQPTEPKTHDERTNHSEPNNVDFRYGCQERCPSSSLGDTHHYDNTERILSTEPFTGSPVSLTGEESDREGGGLKTADATNLTSDSQEDNAINSASSSAKRDNHATVEESSTPSSTGNEGVSVFNVRIYRT